MLGPLITQTIAELDPNEIFTYPPVNRVGELDRKYMNEVLDDGFSNTKDPANMVCRFETSFAQKFESEFAISHNSGSGTMLSRLLAGGIGPRDEVLSPL